MSLNWSLKDCANSDFLQSDEGWPITEGLIWQCLAVGLRGITEKNLDEFYIRSSMLDTIHGGSVVESGKRRGYTLEEIRARIGLSTNVSNETKAGFQKRVVEQLRQAAVWQLSDEKKAKKAA